MRFRLRTFVFTCIGLAMLVVATYYVIGVVSFLANPFQGFAGATEFVDLNGRQAERRISDWPTTVNVTNVQLVSYKSEFSRDAYSTWYRIKMSNGAAERWQDFVHAKKETGPQQHVGDLHEGYEGINRTIPGPPPQHWQTGETPEWWNPPSIDFRATEVMVWYEKFESGVGQAVYSTFDTENNELWIYDYASQHDELWNNGNMPTGKSFGNLTPRITK